MFYVPEIGEMAARGIHAGEDSEQGPFLGGLQLVLVARPLQIPEIKGEEFA